MRSGDGNYRANSAEFTVTLLKVVNSLPLPCDFSQLKFPLKKSRVFTYSLCGSLLSSPDPLNPWCVRLTVRLARPENLSPQIGAFIEILVPTLNISLPSQFRASSKSLSLRKMALKKQTVTPTSSPDAEPPAPPGARFPNSLMTSHISLRTRAPHPHKNLSPASSHHCSMTPSDAL